MLFFKISARKRSPLVPQGVKYIPVDRMLKAIARRKTFIHGAADVWQPTQAQLDAAAKGSFSLKQFVKKILNQGALGSCTAFGWAGAVALMYAIKTGVPVWLAELYIYYYERLINGTINDDSGADVKDGASVLSSRGAPLETSYPYVDTGDTFKQEPPASLDSEAAEHKVVSPLRVSPNVAHIKAALKAELPVVFGFMVYGSFEGTDTASTGIVTMPGADESVLGGHCTYAIGYTDSSGKAKFFSSAGAVKFQLLRAFGAVSNVLRTLTGGAAAAVSPPPNCLIGVNSWGKRWGDSGLFYMPWPYVQQYASDFYIFTDVTRS